MSITFWNLEWHQALRRRRLLALDVGVPLVLVGGIVAGGAPPRHAAAACAVLFAMFGVFGAAVPWARDAERGMLGRILTAGAGARQLLLQRVGADAVLDLLELAPATLVVALAARASPVDLAALAFALAGSLIFANALGIWLATLSESLAETALFAAVGTLVLLHLGGVFRVPLPGSAAATLQPLVPFYYLHEALRAAAGAAQDASHAAAIVAGSTVSALGSLLLTTIISHPLARRAERVP